MYKMEMQNALPDQERLRDSLTFIRGALSIVELQPLTAAVMDRFKEAMDETRELCKAVKSKWREIAQHHIEAPIDQLPLRLIAISAVVTALSAVIQDAASIVRDIPEIQAIWSEDHGLIAETLEMFEKLEETLALGLSAEFRAEIESARSEAGIEADAKNRMRAT